MGGGVMTESGLADRDAGTEVQRLGGLPRAPLAMPRQRLEAPDDAGWLGRLFGWPAVTGNPRTGGQ